MFRVFTNKNIASNFIKTKALYYPLIKIRRIVMKKLLPFILILILGISYSCKLFDKEEPKPIDIYGCMDSTATNYNPEATLDDGSCEYDLIEIYGCMDSAATNYNPEATIDDGSCDYCKAGSAFILLSTDGGNNWEMRCLQEKIGDVSDISMVDSNNIWLCTYASTNENILNSQILHTSNGGITWEEQYSFDNSVLGQVSFEYIEMFDLNNGIALANDWNNSIPMFLKTTDGGINWIQTTTEAIGISGDIWRPVDFVDVNTGYFYESLINPQKLYKTSNSGITWEETNFDGQAHVLKFYDENIGIIVYWNKIYRTIDGGESWALVDTTERGWGSDIEFDPNDPGKVWLLSDGLYFSSDTGSTWIHCFDCTDTGFDAICYSESSLWVYNTRRYLRNIDINDCSSYIEYQLPEYSLGVLSLGSDFDVVGDVIVIPGRIY